jgi:hypothetical protein
VVARRGDWKLIHMFETGESELYHTGKDIGETTNIADDYPELAKELEVRTREWMDDVNAPRMTPNPEYMPDWRPSRKSTPKRRS